MCNAVISLCIIMFDDIVIQRDLKKYYNHFGWLSDWLQPNPLTMMQHHPALLTFNGKVSYVTINLIYDCNIDVINQLQHCNVNTI